jgi:hypothetical protein
MCVLYGIYMLQVKAVKDCITMYVRRITGNNNGVNNLCGKIQMLFECIYFKDAH